MVPKIVPSGVQKSSLHGTPTTGHGAVIKRQSFLDTALDRFGGYDGIVNTGLDIYNATQGKPVATATKPAPAQAQQWQRYALIGGVALGVVALLFFSLRRR